MENAEKINEYKETIESIKEDIARTREKLLIEQGKENKNQRNITRLSNAIGKMEEEIDKLESEINFLILAPSTENITEIYNYLKLNPENIPQDPLSIKEQQLRLARQEGLILENIPYLTFEDDNTAIPDTYAGFQGTGFIKSYKKSLYVDDTFYNTKNSLLSNLFISIRHNIKTLRPISKGISVRLEITEDEEHSYHRNLSKDQIDQLESITLMSELNKFIRNLTATEFPMRKEFIHEKPSGSDPLENYLDIIPIVYQIGYIPQIRGGGLSFTPTKELNKCKILQIYGFACISPPNAANNCLIECFRFALNIKEFSKTIRKKLNFRQNEMLTIETHLPILEEYFNTKTVVICGRDEIGDLLVLHGNPTSYTIPIMYSEEHFSIIRGDIIEKERNERLQYENRKQYTEAFQEHIRRKDIPAIREFLKNKCPTFVNEKIAELEEAFQKPKLTKKEISKLARLKKYKTKKVDDNAEIFYMFFDYETVFIEKARLRPYSLGADIYDSNFTLIERYYESDTVSKDSHHIHNTFTAFIKRYIDPKKKIYMISYNGARFDNFLLAEFLSKNGWLSSTSITEANGQLLKMQFLNFIVLDLCRFVMLPLKTACIGFKCDDNKLDFSHEIPQREYFNNTLHQWLKSNAELLKAYNVQDNIILKQLFVKVAESMKSLSGQNITDFITISQMTFDLWRSSPKGQLVKPPSEENALFCRKAIVAGRSQGFRLGAFSTPKGLLSLDVKSLYPFVMENCLYPIGQEIPTLSYVPNKLGIYRVNIFSQPKTKIIPFRGKTSLDWDYPNAFQTNCTSVDIEILKKYGADIQILNGIYWEESEYIFGDYVGKFREAKTEQDNLKNNNDPSYNPALREMIKLYLNSLSGKVGQREHKTETCFCFNEKQLYAFLNTHEDIAFSEHPEIKCIKVKGKKLNYQYNEKSAKPVQLVCFIYSYARSHMYQSILSKCDNKFFTDTDSCHIQTEDYEKLIDEGHGFGKFHMGGEFGDFENELAGMNVQNYYTVAPKCYGMFGVDKDGKPKNKLRFKGINQRSDRLFEGDINTFNALSIQQKFEIFNSLPKACSEELYKKLTSKDNTNVHILSSHLLRKTGVKGLSGLYQTYLIKKITPKGEMEY